MVKFPQGLTINYIVALSVLMHRLYLVNGFCSTSNNCQNRALEDSYLPVGAWIHYPRPLTTTHSSSKIRTHVFSTRSSHKVLVQVQVQSQLNGAQLYGSKMHDSLSVQRQEAIRSQNSILPPFPIKLFFDLENCWVRRRRERKSKKNIFIHFDCFWQPSEIDLSLSLRSLFDEMDV